MAVNMREVARVAGVSHGTVSNVLNELPTVHPDVRRRVLDAIEATGYVRNETARQLKGGRSRILGLIVLDTANPFYSELANGAQSSTADAETAVMMCNSDNDAAKEDAYLTLFEEHRAQGIILAAGYVSDPLRQKLSSVARRGTPLVLIGRAEDVGSELCTVCGDDAHGARLAAEHLIEQGHTRIAMINGPIRLDVCAQRRAGFEQGVAALTGYQERPALTIGEGYLAAADLLGGENPPTAVFCANDLLALGVLQYAVEHGIAVPDRLAIVGYDDIVYAAGAAIPLTSVRQSGRDIGATAAELLSEEALGSPTHQHRHVVLPPRLIVRRSTVS